MYDDVDQIVLEQFDSE